ncbi:thioesterase family protein [Marinobacterium arenosum]|uniref:thioesterase family protein n=1 Tax=Marinobacterium arenosum TaxID=2862496 RepID=UPI001C97CDF6|nr:thioesterase family protein [Marinobacterium arenosum]MBY4675362.1 thioesterase family protein [Marinobacterium arenosum]
MTETLVVYEGRVSPDWIDYNGHMNDACYVLVFSKAIDEFMVQIGLDEAFREEHQVSIYTLQSMVHYLQEVGEAEPLQVRAQLLESDGKKLRVFFSMWQPETALELAAMETLLLHVDMNAHRAAPFLPETQDKVSQLQRLHNTLAWPELAGRSIALKRPAS